MVEHFPEEEVVVSSILTRGTNCIVTKSLVRTVHIRYSGSLHHEAAQRSGVLTRGTQKLKVIKL